MMKYLAHSAKGSSPVQYYEEHVRSVKEKALRNAQSLSNYYTGDKEKLRDVIETAAEWHDLGKLSCENQAVLSGKSKQKSLPINHVDAGTAYLKERQNIAAAILVYGHHIGLFSRPDEINKGYDLLRDVQPPTFDDTNAHLAEYVQIHKTCIQPNCTISKSEIIDGLMLRLALSCIVDADHTDTARHYGNDPVIPDIALRWEERLAALDTYIEKLNQASEATPRNRLRQEIYESCRNSDIDEPIAACDAPVGSGKTTAVMAYLLKAAIQHNLRHIIVVLPYTNIINQSVDKYREVLTLPGENPEEIVAAHHHQVEFTSDELKALTTLWKAPIIVTTAVQFFETIASHHPSRLRKFYELPGSAVFVDEAHAAMPAWMWPQHWLWMNELTNTWGCRFVLASGSLAKFWELAEFVGNDKKKIPDIVSSEIRTRANEFEKGRIRIQKISSALNRDLFIGQIEQTQGPHLVIMNTVQSAAVLADHFRNAEKDVLHLSTAIAPIHREPIIKQIKSRLKNKQRDQNWILVATSCVEAGLDFSFRTAFRECSSVASLYQASGRSNRHGEDEHAEIFSFRTLDPLMNHHPAFETSSEIVDDFLNNGMFEKYSPAECVTRAMKKEISQGSAGRKKAEELKREEKGQDYPRVSELSRIISTNSFLVVVDPTIIDMLLDYDQRKQVTSKMLVNHSVQVWANKLNLLGVTPFPFSNELFYMDPAQYDAKFLGYMSAMLPVLQLNNDGFMCI